MRTAWFAILAIGAFTVGCSAVADPDTMPDNGVSLRNLVETEVATEAEPGYLIKGDLMATPSDPSSKYYLLHQRRTPSGTVVAVMRQERGNRIAYARTEADCSRRLFHVLGVGDTRGSAEAAIVYDGPLRPIAGLPLRQEMASAVCERAGVSFEAANT